MEDIQPKSLIESPTLDSLLQQSSIQIPKRLHHYTSLESARQILASSSLWASSIHYMNDAQESFVIHTPIISWMAEFEYDFREESPERRFFQNFLRFRFALSLPARYIISFSSEHDDLSQFRAYSKGQTGVCLTFETALLRELSEVKNNSEQCSRKREQLQPDLLKCIYIDETQREIVLQEMRESLEKNLNTATLVNGNEEILAKVTSEYLEQIRPIVKNSSFRSENEWRLVYRDSPQKNDIIEHLIEYRTTPNVLVPYVPISLGFPMKPILKEVMIGPCENQNLNLSSVSKYIETLALKSSQSVVYGDLPRTTKSSSTFRVL